MQTGPVLRRKRCCSHAFRHTFLAALLLVFVVVTLSGCGSQRRNPYVDDTPRKAIVPVEWDSDSLTWNPPPKPGASARKSPATATDASFSDPARKAHRAYILDKPSPGGVVVFDNKRLVRYIIDNQLPSKDFFELQKADNAIAHAWKRIIPRITLNTSLNYPVFGEDGPAYMNQDLLDRLNMYLVSSWNMNIFTYIKDIQQAWAQEQLAEMKVRANREAFTLKALQIYYSLLAGQKNIEAYEKKRGQQSLLVEMVRSGVSSGVQADYALLEMEHQRDLEDIAYLEAHASYVEQYEQFKMLLELPYDIELTLQDPVLPRHYRLPGLEECHRKAMENNAFIYPMNMAKKMLRRAKVATYVERFTNVSVYVSSPSVQMNQRKRTEADNEWWRKTNVGFNWSLPIYDGGTMSRRLSDIEMSQQQLAEQHRTSLRELAQTVRVLHRQCGFLDKKITAQASIVARLEKTHATTLEHARTGAISPDEERISQVTLEDQKKRLEQWRMDRDLAHFRLRILMGEGLPQ